MASVAGKKFMMVMGLKREMWFSRDCWCADMVIREGRRSLPSITLEILRRYCNEFERQLHVSPGKLHGFGQNIADGWGGERVTLQNLWQDHSRASEKGAEN